MHLGLIMCNSIVHLQVYAHQVLPFSPLRQAHEQYRLLTTQGLLAEATTSHPEAVLSGL